jgi:hypothetical protein
MVGDMDMEDLKGTSTIIMSVSVQLAPPFQPMAASMVELLIDHWRENEGWRVCILKVAELRAMGMGSIAE